MQVGQGPLGPAQDPLGKDGLRDAVALQLRGDPLRHLFGIHLLHLAPRNTTTPSSTSIAAPLLPRPGGLLPAVPLQPLAVPLRADVRVRVMMVVVVVMEAVDLYHARRGAHVLLLRVSAEHGRVVSLKAAGSEHLLPGHGGAGMRVGGDAGLGRVYAGQPGAGQRGEALAHARIFVVIRGVQTVHRRQAPVLAHQREAPADVTGDPLVRVMVRMVGMVVVVVSVVTRVIVSAVQQGGHAHGAVAEPPGARAGMRTVAAQQLPVTHGLMAHSVQVANIHRQLCVHDPGSAADEPSIWSSAGMSTSPHCQTPLPDPAAGQQPARAAHMSGAVYPDGAAAQGVLRPAEI
ncbi:hypothetical protein EYF80_049891 [Liparis tanakae]|uniref:Uncharacterized protein n=1 Tax=Liparis tanakae TaxID=230148 RepID=A0A4Z2FGQ2_9TELE|nr:hypothetical protein EYF80_049891 [Liparis tanakae]